VKDNEKWNASAVQEGKSIQHSGKGKRAGIDLDPPLKKLNGRPCHIDHLGSERGVGVQKKGRQNQMHVTSRNVELEV